MKNKFAIYMLSLVLLCSVALNARFVFVLNDIQDDYWVMYFENFKFEDQVYYHLENGENEKAKELLLKSIKTKGMMYFIFTEENYISEEAMDKIKSAKPFNQKH